MSVTDGDREAAEAFLAKSANDHGPGWKFTLEVAAKLRAEGRASGRAEERADWENAIAPADLVGKLRDEIAKERKRGNRLNERNGRLETENSLLKPGSAAKTAMESAYQDMVAELAQARERIEVLERELETVRNKRMARIGDMYDRVKQFGMPQRKGNLTISEAIAFALTEVELAEVVLHARVVKAMRARPFPRSDSEGLTWDKAARFVARAKLDRLSDTEA